MTSAHLSSGSEAFFSLLLFQERIWQPSKGHLLLCCSLQSHQSGAKALLSIPLEAFPLQRFFTSGNVQPLPASLLPTPEYVSVLELLRKNLWDYFLAPDRHLASSCGNLWLSLSFPALFYPFPNNTEVPGQGWWQTASPVLRQSVLELSVAVAVL